jgi:adenylate kinase family enzyme
MDLVLLGAPGSGKGTQADHLCRALGLTHIASGDLFRDHLQRKTALGVRARLVTFHGQTAPVIDYYHLIKLLVTIPGHGPVEDVKRATREAIRRHRPGNV